MKIEMKNIKKKSKIIDFIFNSTMVKADIFWVKEKNKVYLQMYILEDMKWNCKNSRFIYEQRRLLKKKYLKKKFVFFYLKSISVKCISCRI